MSNKVIKELQESTTGSIFDTIPSVPRSAVSSVGRYGGDIWPRRSEMFNEQIQKLWDLEKRFPLSETWAVTQQNKMLCVMNTFTGYYIGGLFRKAVNINRAGFTALNIFFPSVVGSFIFEVFFHAKEITVPMALNPESDNTHLIAKSAGFHVISSCMYQTLFTSVTSVYLASRTNSFPVPENFFSVKESRNYVFNEIIGKTIRQNRVGLLVAMGANFAFSTLFTSFEDYQMKKLFIASQNLK